MERLNLYRQFFSRDSFDGMYPRYTFYRTCLESQHQFEPNDGSVVFLNIKAPQLSGPDAELQAFYHHIQKDDVQSDLTKEISDKIHIPKSDSTEGAYTALALKM